MLDSASIEKSYAASRERYSGLGIDTEKALNALGRIPVSLLCRNEAGAAPSEGGSIPELREDVQEAFRLIPGPRRLGLSAVYAESADGPPERNALEPSHFRGWVEWAKQRNVRLDFSAACFGHSNAASGFTLSHPEKDVRRFWIEHVRRCRRVSASIGRELKAPCIHVLRVPDGPAGDAPLDRWGRRQALIESLDEIFEAEHSPSQMKDALEGLPAGTRAFAVAPLEFCMSYAISRGKLLSLDTGRGVLSGSPADLISTILQFSGEVLVRIPGDPPPEEADIAPSDGGTLALAREIVRGGAAERVHLGVEDPGSGPHRAGLWTAGSRALLQTVLVALLENEGRAREGNNGASAGDPGQAPEFRGLPFGAVWDHYCLRSGVPSSARWRQEVAGFERGRRRGVRS